MINECRGVDGFELLGCLKRHKTIGIIYETGWKNMGCNFSDKLSRQLFNKYTRPLWRTSVFYVLDRTRLNIHSNLYAGRKFTDPVLEELNIN